MIKEIIKKHFDGWSDYTELHEVLDDGVIERICQEVCELQKQECNNTLYDITLIEYWQKEKIADEILNCKNVCT